MDHLMSHVLGAGTQLKHRQNLGAGIDGQPEPEHLRGAAQPGAQLVQLQVREMEMAEAALVQGVPMLPSSREPPRDGGLTVAEDPLSRGSIQPFGQRVIRTMATWCEGVFRRDKGVSRLEVKVVRQA